MEHVLYEVTEPKTLLEMTWEEVEEALTKTDIILLSVASIEEHGYHLPLGTDTFQGLETLKCTARRLALEGITVVVGPAIPFGINPGAMSYPGSVTVQPATLTSLVKDVCGSLGHHGFRNILLLLSHDENYGAIMVAAQELAREQGLNVVCVNTLPYMKIIEKRELSLNLPDGHAGAGETARSLAIHPKLVRLDRVRLWEPDLQPRGQLYEGIPGGTPPLLGGGVYTPLKELRNYSRQAGHPGQTGDPRLAKVEAGRKAYDDTAEWLARIIKREFLGR